FWTATARHADIVLPTTTTLERDDVGAGRNDGYVIAMPRALAPYESARDDYEIFSELAKRLDAWDDYTEGRTARDWVEHIYDRFRERIAERDVEGCRTRTHSHPSRRRGGTRHRRRRRRPRLQRPRRVPRRCGRHDERPASGREPFHGRVV